VTVRVITPALPILTVDEVKRQVRLEADEHEEDAYLASLIAAAQGWIDGPEGWLGRSIGPQLLELRIDHPCSSVVQLPCRPVLEVTAAWAGDDVVTIDPDVLSFGAFDFGSSFSGAPVRVRYWAGYGERAENPAPGEPVWIASVPAPIKHAMLLLIGQWWQSRAAVRIGEAVNTLPFGVEALLQPFRVYD